MLLISTEGNTHSEIINGKTIVVPDMNEAMCGAHLCNSLSKSSSFHVYYNAIYSTVVDC